MSDSLDPEPRIRPGDDAASRPGGGAVEAPGPAGRPGPAPAASPAAAIATTPLAAMERGALFGNRELSWLAFNRRVLTESLDPSVPLLERIKFLAIASLNLDEFFEVRVAGVMELVDANLPGENPDGMKPTEELELIRRAARGFTEELHRTWQNHLVPELLRAGIEIRTVRQLQPDQREWVDSHFLREIYPVLTPLAVDPSHPFPVLLNKSLNLAVLLLDPRQPRKTHRIAVVQVPRVLPRITRLPDRDGRRVYLFTADIVQAHLGVLFPGLEVLHSCSFRVTRDSNIDVDDMQATDLMSSIERELIKRRRGEPVRLEIDHSAHPDIVDRFIRAFTLEHDDVYYCDGPVNLGRVMELYQTIEIPELRDPPVQAAKTAGWASADEMFADLREGDMLVHHPYESFGTIEDFVKLAARDPRVLAIKQTIYRAGSKSPMMDALIEAAQQRKQVTVVVELKARFDEEANIQWARRMEKAGVHVVYGIVGMKTHAKATMIVRREDDGIKRYCHIGTGNYNPTTARLYTDVGLLTARADIGEEVAETFNMITGYARVPPMEHLLVAPFTLRDRMLALIQQEIDNRRAGKPAGIRAKINNLADPQVILALYEASRAGVKIDLCVRSICVLRPGVPGLSDNITVTALIDRFLEHSRIYYFENGGNPLVYLSSADWMIRNLDRRVEVAAPVHDPELKQRVVDEVLGLSLADNQKAHRVLPDGSSERVARPDGAPVIRSQIELLERAQRQSRSAADSPQQGSGDAGGGGRGKQRKKRRRA
ncbi:MAG: polyphosphate kinase 1 [Planctomycetota bacterium]